jgi:AraC-like DNA-binding protein
MQYVIKRYAVHHPLLKKYIKFFWEINSEYLEINHKIIPLRNIDFKFNLSDTPHYLNLQGKDHLLEKVFFSGVHDHFKNAQLNLKGKAHVMGICFLPNGFYPFVKIPVSEFKNKMYGASDVGFSVANTICERLKSALSISERLLVLEEELLMLLNENFSAPDNFIEIFNVLKSNSDNMQISDFCDANNISIRKLERMFNKYVGVSAKTYSTINRFQNSMSQLLYTGYSKLSDIAYENGYFDQMHFIKDFKRFAGKTPKSFVNQNDSILQVGKFA